MAARVDGQDELDVESGDEREPQTMAELLAMYGDVEPAPSRQAEHSRSPRMDPRWQELAERQQRGELLEAAVIEVNRGGAVVDVGLPGFVPLSQLTSVGAIQRQPEGGPSTGVPEALRALRGRTLSLQVIEVDPGRNRLILSEKAALQEVRRRRKATAARELAVGDVLEGTVTHMTGFGLFVDVGIADGLVHRSEITWNKAVNPMAVHAVGDEVRVLVTGVDPERRRISLSIKQLSEDPWARVAADLGVGTDVDAVITRLMPFGAFARIADGLEGLIHISELADHRVTEPADVVAVGDETRVRVVGVDHERRRLSLSIRQAERT